MNRLHYEKTLNWVLSLSHLSFVFDFVFVGLYVYLCESVCLTLCFYVRFCLSLSSFLCVLIVYLRVCVSAFMCFCVWPCVFVLHSLSQRVCFSDCVFAWLCGYLWGVPIKSSQRCLLMWLKFISNEIVQNTKQNIIQICACQSRRHSLGFKKIGIFLKTSQKYILIWLKLTSNKNIPSPSEIGG